MNEDIWRKEREAKEKRKQADWHENDEDNGGWVDHASDLKAFDLRQQARELDHQARQARLDADFEARRAIDKRLSDADDARRASERQAQAKKDAEFVDGVVLRVRKNIELARQTGIEQHQRAANAPEEQLDALLAAARDEGARVAADVVRRRLIVDALEALCRLYMGHVEVSHWMERPDGAGYLKQSMGSLLGQLHGDQDLAFFRLVSPVAAAIDMSRIDESAWPAYALLPIPPRKRLSLADAWLRVENRPTHLIFGAAPTDFCSNNGLMLLAGKRGELFDALHLCSLHREALGNHADRDILAHEILATYFGAAILGLPDDAVAGHATFVLRQLCRGVAKTDLTLPDDQPMPSFELDHGVARALGNQAVLLQNRQQQLAPNGVSFSTPFLRALREKAKPLPDSVYADLSASRPVAAAPKQPEAKRGGFLKWIFGETQEPQPAPSGLTPSARKHNLSNLRLSRLYEMERLAHAFWDENAQLELDGKPWQPQAVLDQRLAEAEERHANAREQARLRGEI
jgi:hypothetical protein